MVLSLKFMLKAAPALVVRPDPAAERLLYRPKISSKAFPEFLFMKLRIPLHEVANSSS